MRQLPGWERVQSPPEPRAAALRLLARPRAPRATARRMREPLGPCSRGGPHPRRPHRRCRLRTTPRSRSDPCTTEPREGRGASGFFAPAPPAEAPPEAPTRPRSRLGSRLRCSASPTRPGAGPSLRRPRPAGVRAGRAPGRRPPESAARPPHECGSGANGPSRRRPPAPRAAPRERRVPGDPSPPTRTGVHRRARRSTPHPPW